MGWWAPTPQPPGEPPHPNRDTLNPDDYPAPGAALMPDTGSPVRDHIGRSWTGTHIEDTCPCPKAPCGLIVQEQAVEDCGEHHWTAEKSMRQSHPANRCPAI